MKFDEATTKGSINSPSTTICPKPTQAEIDADSQRIMMMFQEVTKRRRNAGTMARCPPFLRKLIEAINEPDDNDSCAESRTSQTLKLTGFDDGIDESEGPHARATYSPSSAVVAYTHTMRLRFLASIRSMRVMEFLFVLQGL